MSEIKSIKIKLDVIEKQAIDALQKVQRQTEIANQTFASFLGNLASNIATSALNKLADGFSSAISASLEANKNVEQLNLVLQQTGRFSEEGSKSLLDYADSLSKVTVFSQGQIVEAEKLLAQYTRLDTQGIQQVTKSAAEMAAFFGMDLKQATEILTDAYNGKYKALKGLGIQFDETKDRGSSFASILKELENFSGSNERKLQTLDGALARLSNAWDDVWESVGNLITQNPIFLQGIQLVTKGLESLIQKINSFNEWAKQNQDLVLALGTAFSVLAAGMVAVGAKVVLTSGLFSTLATAASAAWAAITGPIGLVTAGIAAVAGATMYVFKNWELVKFKVLDAVTTILEKIQAFQNSLGLKLFDLTPTINSLKAATEEARIAYEVKQQQEQVTTQVTEQQTQTRIQAYKQEKEAHREKVDSFVEQLARKRSSLEEETNYELELLRLRYEAENIQAEEDYAYKLQLEQSYYDQRQALLNEKYQQELARIDQSNADYAMKLQAKEQLERDYALKSEQMQLELSRKQVELQRRQAQEEQRINQFKLQSTASFFGALADLARTGGRKNFEAVKAFSYAEAVVSGYLAVQRALASGPYPWNLAMAAAVGIQTAANITRISAMQPPAFEQGGIVPGSSYTGDRVLARVNSGEMILNRSQQQNLFNQINSGFNNSEVVTLLKELIFAVRSGSVIQIDGKEVFRAVKSYTDAGYALT